MPHSLWVPIRIYPYTFHLLNLDHPDIEATILREIKSGVDVYYDRRWDITKAFCQFLIKHPQLVNNLSILVLGAGIGMETLVIGRLCKKIYLNDIAPIALDLCVLQLRKNDIKNYELLPGRYENLEYPIVDIVIGCYIVYNKETLKAMKRFLNRCPHNILLMNEYMPTFERLLKTSQKRIRSLFSEEGHHCILIE